MLIICDFELPVRIMEEAAGSTIATLEGCCIFCTLNFTGYDDRGLEKRNSLFAIFDYNCNLV